MKVVKNKKTTSYKADAVWKRYIVHMTFLNIYFDY